MGRLIKDISDGKKVIFDQGRFDDWCVYIIENDGNKYAPKDIAYFNRIAFLSKIYSPQKIYSDFISIYDSTTKEINEEVLFSINEMSHDYNLHSQEMELWFTVLYAGMVAEENKEKAILKKRIKRLGMFQILEQQMAPENAAVFSKGKKWKELDKLMKGYGF